MRTDEAHPTETSFNTSKYGYFVTAQTAANLYGQKIFNTHAFICGRKREDGTGKCFAHLTLCAIDSDARDPYFRRTDDLEPHTCGIKIEETTSSKMVNPNSAKDHVFLDDNQGFFDFWSGSVEKNETNQIIKSEHESQVTKSNGRSRNFNIGLSGNTVRQHPHLNTLQKIVDNRDTTQMLPGKKGYISLNDLFFQLRDSRSNPSLPIPNVQPIWESAVQIYPNEKTGQYKLFFPHQTINGEIITSHITSNQLHEILPDYEKYVSDYSDKTRRFNLRLYTVETVKSKEGMGKDGKKQVYENLLIDYRWKHIKEHILIRVPRKLRKN